MQTSIKKENVNRFFLFLGFISITVFLPLLQNQFIVGSIINASLFLSVVMIGLRYAILLGLIPSLIACFVGFISMSLLPLIAFIMLSNVTLVLAFYFLKNKSYPKAMFVAGLLKCLLLIVVVTVVAKLTHINSQILAILTWPQVITVILGSLIAGSIFKLKGYLIR